MWYYQIRLKSNPLCCARQFLIYGIVNTLFTSTSKEITVFFLRVKNNSFHQRPLGEQKKSPYEGGFDHFLKVVHLNAIKGYMSNNGYEQQFEKKVVILESLFLM